MNTLRQQRTTSQIIGTFALDIRLAKLAAWGAAAFPQALNKAGYSAGLRDAATATRCVRERAR